MAACGPDRVEDPSSPAFPHGIPLLAWVSPAARQCRTHPLLGLRRRARYCGRTAATTGGADVGADRPAGVRVPAPDLRVLEVNALALGALRELGEEEDGFITDDGDGLRIWVGDDAFELELTDS